MMPDSEPVQPTTGTGEEPLKVAFRKIPIFADLSDEQVDWFASNCEDVRSPSGDVVVHEGDPADVLIVLLQGQLLGRRDGAGADSSVYIVHAGQVTGMLPFSRLTVFPVTFRAFGQVRVARLHKDRFPQMMERIPQLTPRLVNLLADRVREVSRADQQRDKLMA